LLASQNLQSRQARIGELVDRLANAEVQQLFLFLSDRIANPEAYIVALGETSSGKSALLNGLVGRHLLPMKANPSSGTVIELRLSEDLSLPRYSALNRDATMEDLAFSEFAKLAEAPDKELLRLRAELPAKAEYHGLRVFDTPGYGSIMQHHDEVLKEFIPESDVVVYLVSYRVGFQSADRDFLTYAYELMNEDAELILVLNRCPAETVLLDRRVQEVRAAVRECLHKDVRVFLVHTAGVGSGQLADLPPVPQSRHVWEAIAEVVRSEDRRARVYNHLLAYQNDLLVRCKQIVERGLDAEQVSAEDRKSVMEMMLNVIQTKSQAQEIITVGFADLRRKMPGWVKSAADRIAAELKNDIRSNSKWTEKDDSVAFVTGHLLPFKINAETLEIRTLVRAHIEELDHKVDNLLNSAINNLLSEAKVRVPAVVNILEKGLARAGENLLSNALQQFFAKFGGAGGPGAGVANAASRGLKWVGNLFGRKFSSATHNALKSTLKKIGATSARAISIAAIVLVEVVAYIYDAKTWQNKLIAGVEKSLSAWEEEVRKSLQVELADLERHNLQLINTIFEGYATEVTFDDTSEDLGCYKQLLSDIEKELKVTHEH